MTELFSKCVRWMGFDCVFADGWLIASLIVVVDVDGVDSCLLYTSDAADE